MTAQKPKRLTQDELIDLKQAIENMEHGWASDVWLICADYTTLWRAVTELEQHRAAARAARKARKEKR